jgi:hypothetical protein
MVIRFGSPPKDAIFSFVHSRAANMSKRPKLPPEPDEDEARVFRKPEKSFSRNQNKLNFS